MLVRRARVTVQAESEASLDLCLTTLEGQRIGRDSPAREVDGDK